MESTGNKRGRKKVRRSMRTRKCYNKFKVYYVNIRGIKSKRESLQEIIDKEKPVIICITETHLGEDEQFNISGYKVFLNNRNNEGGGVLIGVKDEISSVAVEVKKEQVSHEAIWIKIDNGRIKIRIGVIYAPQENKVKNEEITNMYETVTKEIQKAIDNDEKIVLMGDFNCKIGGEIRNNKEDVSKGGKEFIKVIKQNKLSVLNNSIRCEGRWTRIQNDQKSIIDYGIIREEDEDSIVQVTIDENKEITPYRISDKIVYTDHCAILTEMDWRKGEKQKEKRKYVINMNKLKEQQGKDALIKAVEGEGTVKKKYKRWQGEVEKILQKCRRKINTSKAKITKPIRMLMKAKRRYKVKGKKAKELRERKLARIQEKLIEEYIIEERKKEEGCMIRNTVDDIKEKGGVNSPAFWDFKKKMEGRKQEGVSAVKRKDGKVVEEVSEIKEEYKNFYTELFIIEGPSSKIGKVAEDTNMMYHKWLQNSERVAQENLEKFETKEIEEIIKNLKNKHTPDRQGINNVVIKAMGEEMTQSITIIANQIEEEASAPEEWEEIKILSHHKKGSKMDLENRRGIFITSNISKICEKARMKRIKEKLESKISRFQCGGLEGRSTVDHLLTLNAVIDYNNFIGAPTFVVFGDAYKCFDKLDIRDCIKELGKMVGWKEALLALKMNENGRALIDCPAGEAGEVSIKENVRQGTIYGPKLCSIVTDRINQISRKTITLIRNIEIEALIYVDDIMFPTSKKESVEKMIGNFRSMEELKKFTFSPNPTKSAILKMENRRKKQKENINTKVKKGEISMVKEYKYLGEWFNEKGTKEENIERRKKKVKFFLKEVRRYGDEGKVGNLALEVRLKIYETVVVPTLFANIETWSNIAEKEYKEMESMQSKILRGIFELPISTPYWGIIAETGVWPVESRIEYKKIMLFHNIIQDDEKRLIKEIIEDQLRSPYGKCWVLSIKEICEKYELEIEEIRNWEKRKIKKEIKERIRKHIEKTVEEKSKEMKKLRFVNGIQKNDYIKRLNIRESLMIMKAKLNMLELKANFRGKYEDEVCDICQESEDNTEHLFDCQKLKRLIDHPMDIGALGEPNKSLAQYLEKAMLIKCSVQRARMGGKKE